MTFEEFVRYIGTPAALGVVSSVVLTIIKKFAPQVQEFLAFGLSLIVAALAYIVAAWAVPLLPQLPAQFELYWPAVVFLAQQLWYWITKDVVEARILGKR